MNKIIKLLIFSDIFFLTGFGLIDPIMAIFIKDNLIGGTIFGAGLASMLFFITKSIIQLPFSRYVDAHDYKAKWLLVGSAIIVAVPFLYIFVKDITYIYIMQIVRGVGAGLVYPCWLGLWSTHLDKHHESFEWSLYSTVMSVGYATAGAVGGALAQYIGFRWVFAGVGLMSFIGFLVLFKLEVKHEKKIQWTRLFWKNTKK